VITLSAADRRTRIGGLILDLTLTEELSFEADVSMYPVEAGVTISDHVTQGAETLRISGTIPTQDVMAYEANQEGVAKVVDVAETLRKMHADRGVLEVSTGQLLYQDFAFTRMTATRSADADGGNWFSISAELTKVRKVELRTAEVPAEEKVSTQDGAQGRAGQTNKPTGKNGSAGSASSTDAAGAQTNPKGQTLTRGALRALGYQPPTP